MIQLPFITKITITSFRGVESLFFILKILIYPFFSSSLKFSCISMIYLLFPVAIHLIRSVTLKFTKSNVIMFSVSKDCPTFINYLIARTSFSVKMNSINFALKQENLIISISAIGMYFCSDLVLYNIFNKLVLNSFISLNNSTLY